MAFLVPSAFAQAPTSWTLSLPNLTGYTTFGQIINAITLWLFNISIPIAVIIIIWGGVLMLTARGDAAQFKRGTQALTYAMIGLAVIFIGKGFVSLVQSILGGAVP